MLAMAIVASVLMTPVQWLTLPRSLSKRWLWLIACPAAHVFASLFVAVQTGVPSTSPFIAPLFALAGGAVSGAITGVALHEMVSPTNLATTPTAT
jgi:hypothetical protein